MQVLSINTYNSNNTNNSFRGRKINEKKLLNNLSKNTYVSIDAYITNLLNVVTNLDSNEIKSVIKIGLENAKIQDKNSFYKFYSKIMQHIMMTRKRIIPNNRENWYADITSTILGNKSFDKNSIYLDIGCGDCNITRSIANKIGIDIQNVHLTHIWV